MLAPLKISPWLTGFGRPAADLLHHARAQERAARISDAIASYEAAIAAAEGAREPAPLAEALRRLAVIRHHRNESDQARRLCPPSSRARRKCWRASAMASVSRSIPPSVFRASPASTVLPAWRATA